MRIAKFWAFDGLSRISKHEQSCKIFYNTANYLEIVIINFVNQFQKNLFKRKKSSSLEEIFHAQTKMVKLLQFEVVILYRLIGHPPVQCISKEQEANLD